MTVGPWRALYSTDGLMWFATTTGNLYNINPAKKATIPYYPISQPEANSFYYDAKKNILWIGTLKGLVRKDLSTQSERSWIHDPLNSKVFAVIASIVSEQMEMAICGSLR